MNATHDGLILRTTRRGSHHFCGRLILLWLVWIALPLEAQSPAENETGDPITVESAKVMVIDLDSLAANANPNGSEPLTLISSGQTLTRKLRITNDTSAGTGIIVQWTLHLDSETGPVVDAGNLQTRVAQGRFASESITFKIPEAPSGTSYFLVLRASKEGGEVFRGPPDRFVIFHQTLLSGKPFGASPPFDSNATHFAAIDGDPATYYDFAQPDGGFTGIDLGANKARRISSITFTPREGFESRMIGGRFEGSNDGVNYAPLYTIKAAPISSTSVLVNSYTAYRHLRYAGPGGSYGNIAEMAFYTTNAPPLIGFAFGAMPPYTAGNEYDKATDGNADTYYDFLNASGGYTGIDLGAENGQRISYIVFTPRPGFEARMTGGTFYGSNDGVNYTAMHTISAPPEGAPNNTTIFLKSPIRYRFLKYAGGANSNCNIAEMAFYKW